MKPRVPRLAWAVLSVVYGAVCVVMTALHERLKRRSGT